MPCPDVVGKKCFLWICLVSNYNGTERNISNYNGSERNTKV